MRTNIFRVAAVFCFALMSAPACFANVFTYDYSTATGSAFPGTVISGNDNWVVTGGGINVRNDGDTIGFAGFSGNLAYRGGSGDTQATRINDSDFSFSVPSGTERAQLSFNVRARNNGGYLMSFALADGGLGGEVGPQFGLQNNNWFIRAADFGSQTNVSAGLTSTSEGYRVVLDMDLAANGGDGSGSVSVQNLETAGPLTAIVGLQNINLGILSMDGGSSDTGTWDSLYIRLAGGGASVDSLTVFVPSPEPSTAVLAALGFASLGLFRRRRPRA